MLSRPRGIHHFSGIDPVVTAWATENRLVLGATAVPDGSNEVAAIPELLRTLDLAGAIVTIDAAGCQVQTTSRPCGRPSRRTLTGPARRTSSGSDPMVTSRSRTATGGMRSDT